MLADTITKLESGYDLTQAEMADTIDLVMQGVCTEDSIRSLLLALVAKGETVAEIAGAATAMRTHMTPLHSTREDLVDTCGTGGDGSGTFNISTAAAIVAAGAGIAVAKHGNRRITSKTGSADVLMELGVNIEAPVKVMEQCLEEAGICFCFAPLFHEKYPVSSNWLEPILNFLRRSSIFYVLRTRQPFLTCWARFVIRLRHPFSCSASENRNYECSWPKL